MIEHEKQLADRAFANHILLSKLCHDSEIYEYEKGRILYEVFQEKQYQALGYETLNSYIAQPEINLSRSSAYLYKQIWAKFVIELGIVPQELMGVGVTKLRKLIKYVDDDNWPLLLQLARTLSKSDLEKELAEMFGEEPKEKSNRLYLIKLDEDIYGVDWFFLVRAGSIEEAREKAKNKYMEDYLADYERVHSGSINPKFSEIELDNQGVSKPIEIEK